jgi:ABC-type nitrate/sulfonate/bicarbonate transport system permease component
MTSVMISEFVIHLRGCKPLPQVLELFHISLQFALLAAFSAELTATRPEGFGRFTRNGR